jgi:hypothetical protein
LTILPVNVMFLSPKTLPACKAASVNLVKQKRVLNEE